VNRQENSKIITAEAFEKKLRIAGKSRNHLSQFGISSLTTVTQQTAGRLGSRRAADIIRQSTSTMSLHIGPDCIPLNIYYRVAPSESTLVLKETPEKV
jgi:hypothetical protein